MAIEQGNRVRHGTLLVHVVDVERPKIIHVDISREHWQLIVEVLFMLSSVVPALPPLHESLDVSQMNTVLPISVLELVGERSKFKFAAEEFEFAVRNGDCERDFGHCE